MNILLSPFMSQALDLAASAAERGEVPVGALIVRDGRVLNRSVQAMMRVGEMIGVLGDDGPDSVEVRRAEMRRAAGLGMPWK